MANNIEYYLFDSNFLYYFQVYPEIDSLVLC